MVQHCVITVYLWRFFSDSKKVLLANIFEALQNFGSFLAYLRTEKVFKQGWVASRFVDKFEFWSIEHGFVVSNLLFLWSGLRFRVGSAYFGAIWGAGRYLILIFTNWWPTRTEAWANSGKAPPPGILSDLKHWYKHKTAMQRRLG